MTIHDLKNNNEFKAAGFRFGCLNGREKNSQNDIPSLSSSFLIQESIIAQSGRSMVEMLGTLAIIGVLSIGGITGYSYAMDKYRANEIINDIMLRAVDLNAQLHIRPEPNIDAWATTTAGKYTIGLEKNGEYVNGIQVSGLPKHLCKMVFDGIINNAIIKIGTTEYDTPTDNVCEDTNTMVFYVDEDSSIKAENSTTTTSRPSAVPCEWTDWINESHPSAGSDNGDIETYDWVCKKEYVQDIECRSATEPYLSWELFGQVAQCNKNVGFVCKNSDQPDDPFGLCYDYEIRVFCCRPTQ